MALMSNIVRFVRDRMTGASVVVQPFLSKLNLLNFGPNMKAAQLIQFYRHWVFVAASKNAQAVASVPLRLYVTTNVGEKQYKYLRKGVDTRPVDPKVLKRLKAKKSLAVRLAKAVDVEEVVDHAFIDLWRNVNPKMNGFEMLNTLQLFLELTGNAYLYEYKNSLGVTEELWVLPSQYVTIVPSKEDFVEGYLYGTSKANAIALAADEVTHFKFPNPFDMFYGYSPLQACISAAIRKDDMDAFEDSLLKNYARPDFVLSTKNRIRKGDVERLREEFQKLYGRRKGRGRPAVLDNDLKIETLGFSPREMAMLKGQKFTREEILAAYGVPNSKVTAEDVNLANAEVGEVQYQRDTILPRLNLNEDKLNEDLVSDFDPRLFVAFDNPVPENQEFRLKERDTNLKNYSWTINEVREEEGKEPVEYGDVPLVSFNIIPLGAAAPAGAGAEAVATEEEEGKAVAKTCHGQKIFAAEPLLINWDYTEPHDKNHAGDCCCDGLPFESKQNQFSDIAPATTKLLAMEKILRRWFADLEKMVMNVINPKTWRKDVPPEIIGFELEFNQIARMLDEMIGPTLREQLARGGEIGMRQIQSNIAFDVLNPEVAAFLRRYTAHFSRIVSRTTSDRFTNQLRIGLEKGEGVRELTARFQKMFTGLKQNRARMIARSEASRSVHGGMIAAWQQSGLVEAEIWDAQTDACPFCLAMDGRVVSLGANFFNLNDTLTVEDESGREITLNFGYEAVAYPPLHPNCVCTVRAVMKGES